MELPEELQDFFDLPSVQTVYLQSLSNEEKQTLGTHLSPTLRVLPMGWPWSGYFQSSGAPETGREGLDKGMGGLPEEESRGQVGSGR